MYNCIKDTYTCDLCGFEMEWDASDLVHGEMWGCEKCGDTFCSKCFIDRHGRKEYMKMMQGSVSSIALGISRVAFLASLP